MFVADSDIVKWLYVLALMVYQSGERFGTPNPFFLSLPAFLFFFIE
jgi:hypothetical protein